MRTTTLPVPMRSVSYTPCQHCGEASLTPYCSTGCIDAAFHARWRARGQHLWSTLVGWLWVLGLGVGLLGGLHVTFTYGPTMLWWGVVGIVILVSGVAAIPMSVWLFLWLWGTITGMEHNAQQRHREHMQVLREMNAPCRYEPQNPARRRELCQ